MINPFLCKLRRGARLSAEDERLLEGLSQPGQRLGAKQDIVAEGQRPRSLTLVLTGWACRYRVLENGRRQIITFFLPGDLCEPFGTLPRFMDHSIGSLTPLAYVRVSPDQIRAAAQASPLVEQALWWDALTASAVQHERVVSLGRRQAVERVGHLLCELHMRLQVVGLADRTSFDFPLTQADLADALGLSTVHINRSLQELRADGLITLRERRVTIRNVNALRETSMFDPAYLHLNDDHHDPA